MRTYTTTIITFRKKKNVKVHILNHLILDKFQHIVQISIEIY